MLIKAGVLQGIPGTTVTFSSPLAKRYFYSKYFTNRAMHSTYNNLQDLAIQAIGKMSALVLSQSLVPDTSTFPKEAIIQHLFMESLLSLTKFNVKILPELGRTYPTEEEEITASAAIVPGEIDFYLRNDNFSWGIEVSVEGRGVGEHVRRFGRDGKYSRLQCTDYVNIDLRRGKATHSAVMKDEKKITAFFESDNFQECSLIVGLSEDILSIRLEP
jgi:hypothetical protein